MPNRLADFHSTAKADEGVHYYWITEPPSNADDDPFSAEYGIPETNLKKRSSFFPMDLDPNSVLEIIGDAYIKGGCIPNGVWTGVGTDSFTGVNLPVEGYVEIRGNIHHITTAYPGGLPNEGD
jgi:hypothetical protein